MTDAHAKAVEAAVIAHWGDCYTNNPRLQNDFEKDMAAAIAAFLAAMRAEGWVMVRDVGMSKHDNLGWNACRAAMLKGEP